MPVDIGFFCVCRCKGRGKFKARTSRTSLRVFVETPYPLVQHYRGASRWFIITSGICDDCGENCEYNPRWFSAGRISLVSIPSINRCKFRVFCSGFYDMQGIPEVIFFEDKRYLDALFGETLTAKEGVVTALERTTAASLKYILLRKKIRLHGCWKIW